MRTITFDLEICDPVEECPDGWDGARKGDCGVSVLCLHDSASERFHVYDLNDLDKAVDHLNQADLLISFNGIEFDIPCLQGVTDMTVHPENYDILHEIWRSLNGRRKGYKLDDISRRLELGQKNSHGEMATKLFRDGKFGRLVDYCMNDVDLTLKLAKWIDRYGYILGPDGEQLALARVGIDE